MKLKMYGRIGFQKDELSRVLIHNQLVVSARARERDESDARDEIVRKNNFSCQTLRGLEENYLSVRALDGEPNFSLPVMGMCAPRIVI